MKLWPLPILLSITCTHLISQDDSQNPEGTPDLPAAFIYDPGSGQSITNLGSSRLGETSTLRAISGSFTFEAYVKPNSIPKQNVGILKWSSDDGAEVDAGLRWLRNFKQWIVYLPGGEGDSERPPRVRDRRLEFFGPVGPEYLWRQPLSSGARCEGRRHS